MLARGEFSGMIPMTLTPDLRTILTLSIRADVVPDCEIAKTTSSFESELADINCMCGSEINDDDIFSLKNLCCASIATGAEPPKAYTSTLLAFANASIDDSRTSWLICDLTFNISL